LSSLFIYSELAACVLANHIISPPLFLAECRKRRENCYLCLFWFIRFGIVPVPYIYLLVCVKAIGYVDHLRSYVKSIRSHCLLLQLIGIYYIDCNLSNIILMCYRRTWRAFNYNPWRLNRCPTCRRKIPSSRP